MQHGNSRRDDRSAKGSRGLRCGVKTYTDCLAQEQQQKLDAGGDKVKLQKHYAELNNAQVEKCSSLPTSSTPS